MAGWRPLTNGLGIAPGLPAMIAPSCRSVCAGGTPPLRGRLDLTRRLGGGHAPAQWRTRARCGGGHASAQWRRDGSVRVTEVSGTPRMFVTSPRPNSSDTMKPDSASVRRAPGARSRHGRGHPDQPLARDPVVPAARDPGDRTLHGMHKRSRLRSPLGRASFFTHHMQKLARPVRRRQDARICTWFAVTGTRYRPGSRPDPRRRTDWNAGVTDLSQSRAGSAPDPGAHPGPRRPRDHSRYATTSPGGRREGGSLPWRGQPRWSRATNRSSDGMPSASRPCEVRRTSGVRQ